MDTYKYLEWKMNYQMLFRDQNYGNYIENLLTQGGINLIVL